MKLLYATSMIFPSKFANRLQVLQMSEFFSKTLKKGFILGGLDIKNTKKDLEIINIKGSPRSILLALKYLFLIKENQINYLYCREEKLLFLMILYNKLFFRLNLKFAYEAHFVFEKKYFWYKKMLDWSDKVIVLTSYIKNEFVELGINKDKIMVAPDGVNLENFNIKNSKNKNKKLLGLPSETKIVMYTGRLHDWKGASLLAKAATELKEISFVFVGGTDKELIDFRKLFSKFRNIFILGFKKNELIPKYLTSSDLLVLPNSSKNIISEKYTSPMKLFEYMASGVPIIASNIPSIKEILSEKNAILFKSDDVDDLISKIKLSFKEYESLLNLSNKAKKDVLNYQWSVRAKNVLEFLNE